MKKLYLIDGNAIVHRAYHALAPLTTSKGEQVNAVYGMLRMILKLLKSRSPEYLAVCFDYPAPTFRHKEYPQYKATRKKTDDELKNQFPIAKEFIKALKLPLLEVEGYEADDIIATIASQSRAEGADVVIVTGDKDALQLVDKNISVLNEQKEVFFDEKMVVEKFGLKPSQLIDYFALLGDNSDNVPGVKGIGEVTALKLIKEYGSLDEIYRNLGQIPSKISEKLSSQRDMAYLSKYLITLNRTVPLDCKLEQLKIKAYNFDNERLLELLRRYEFVSLIKELIPMKTQDIGYSRKIIFTKSELEELCHKILMKKKFAIDLETTSLDFFKAEIVGISISTDISDAYYIPIGHKYLGAPAQLSREEVFEKLKSILEDEKIHKCGHNLKYEILVLKNNGIKLNGVYFDTMVASYCLNPAKQNHNLKEVVFEVFGDTMTEIDELIGKKKEQKTIDSVSIEEVADYAMADSHYVMRLEKNFSKEIEEKKLTELFFNIEMPLVEVLARMEEAGIKIDIEYLKNLSSEFGSKISKIEKEVHKIAGQEFNLNSPKQLSFILFEKLKLPPVRKTKTGLSTDEEVLKILSSQHELPKLLLTHRELTKLKSTYIDSLIERAETDTNRIHTSFNQTVTATGRLSSSEPNLQNIPVRSEEGRKIRRSFIAEDGFILLSADYSQIDLRVLAHLSGDENLCDAFKNGEDIHMRTAIELFGNASEAKEIKKNLRSEGFQSLVDGANSHNKSSPPIHRGVSEANRRIAKTINFGIIYGMSAYGLAQSLGIDQSVAAEYIENYFSKYSGVRRWIEKTLEFARLNGYVSTLMGRRRYIPEINSTNNQVKSAAERVAINTPVQGTSADIIKVAMINIHKKVKGERLKVKSQKFNVKDVADSSEAEGERLKDVRMLIQVHDELLFEVPEKNLEAVCSLIKTEMESAVKLIIPIVVDLKYGKNWDEMKVFK